MILQPQDVILKMKWCTKFCLSFSCSILGRKGELSNKDIEPVKM